MKFFKKNKNLLTKKKPVLEDAMGKKQIGRTK